RRHTFFTSGVFKSHPRSARSPLYSAPSTRSIYPRFAGGSKGPTRQQPMRTLAGGASRLDGRRSAWYVRRHQPIRRGPKSKPHGLLLRLFSSWGSRAAPPDSAPGRAVRLWSLRRTLAYSRGSLWTGGPCTASRLSSSSVKETASDPILDIAVSPDHDLEETKHGPIHRRLPLRQRPNGGVGTPIPGRPLSLPGLPQASWSPFSRFRRVPEGCGDDRGRNTRLRRTVFLSPLRLVHFRTHRRRDRSEPGIFGCPRPADADVRKLDRPSRVLAAAISTYKAVRARS